MQRPTRVRKFRLQRENFSALDAALDPSLSYTHEMKSRFILSTSGDVLKAHPYGPDEWRSEINKAKFGDLCLTIALYSTATGFG